MERRSSLLPPNSDSPNPPKFTVYQNPNLSQALTKRSTRPSFTTCIINIVTCVIASGIGILLKSQEKKIVPVLSSLIWISPNASFWIIRTLQFFASLLVSAKAAALIKVFTGRIEEKSVVSSVTSKQLKLMGLKPTATQKPPKSNPTSPSPSPAARDTLVPVRRSAFARTPSRPSSTAASPASPSPSPSSHWTKQSPGNAKGILTEAKLDQYLANIDEKMVELTSRADIATPPSKVQSFGVATPVSIASSATASGAARSTPLRPVRMSPGSHQKYTTPPKKGEGEFPPPMSMEQAVSSFENLGLYPDIQNMRDRLRQWFSSTLINPLCDKLETSNIQVMQAAAALGISVTVSPVGSEPVTTTVPVNVSLINGAKEWQPAVTVDEDGVLYQLRASLVQARDTSLSQPHVGSPQQSQQNPMLPLIQQCVNAITEHQRLNTLMKGELIKGLLVHSSERADYTVQRVRELSEGTCLRNYEYLGNSDGYDKTGKKWSNELPTDSHLLLYLFCAFLEHPKWSLHVDPTSNSSAQSSKHPLFLGVLPPKDRFPEKYVAVISGVPSIIHPGACILSVGKQNPPIFALYWDKKLQFSLQGRTALWDAIILLCHRINYAYGGVVRGVHLGSPAFNILPVLDPNDEN